MVKAVRSGAFKPQGFLPFFMFYMYLYIIQGMQLTLLAKSTCHHKNTSYFVNFTDNHTRFTLSSSLHIFLAKNYVVS